MRLMTVTPLGKVSNSFWSILIGIIILYKRFRRASSCYLDHGFDSVSGHDSSTSPRKTRSNSYEPACEADFYDSFLCVIVTLD